MLVSSMSVYVVPGVRVMGVGVGVGVGGAAVMPSTSFETILPPGPLPWTVCGVGKKLLISILISWSISEVLIYNSADVTSRLQISQRTMYNVM